MDSWPNAVWYILPLPPFQRAGRLARANNDNMHSMTDQQTDPFAPLPKKPPKRKPKYKRRSPAEMAQDAAKEAALVRSQAYIPDNPAMRQDKPHRAMRVAYSPMSTPPSEDAEKHVVSIAKAAGVDVQDGDTLEDVFGGVVKLSPFACARACMLLFSLASGARHKEAFLVSGLNIIDLNLFCRLDESFSKTYEFAKRLQADAMSLQVLDSAHERAVNGVLDPIVGRTGKDMDGQLLDRDGQPMYRVRHSDKMAEILLRATDKRFRDDQGGAGTGAGTTYNIQINHAPPDVVRVQDCHETGGKAAENEDDDPETLDFSDVLDE